MSSISGNDICFSWTFRTMSILCSHICCIHPAYVMYTVLILAHTIDNSFNKENRIKHYLHLEVCHVSNELDGVATCHQ